MKKLHSALKNIGLFIFILSTSVSATVAQPAVVKLGSDHHEAAQHTDEYNDGHSEQHEDKHGANDDHGDKHHEEGHIEISTTNAQAAGIINATANAGEIKNMLTVYGRVVMSSDAISQVSARFPGLITKLTVNVGDTVQAGETIAQVESNNSFKHYNITAPISGIVTQRHVNPGESVNQQALLTLENYQQLWVEYKIFPSQTSIIKKGQMVIISSPSEQKKSTITHLMSNKNQTFMTARVPLNNRDGLWSPGQILKGSVVTSQTSVDLVVDNRAFQEVEGKRVVFVTNQDGYETRELKIGQSDGQFSQVISGLNIGEQYALINSYLLKADLGKAGASHAH
tara:strand:- start:23435 stop:24454 length:1020 start_codon:yes stop_codon:yes gene_type:complete